MVFEREAFFPGPLFRPLNSHISRGGAGFELAIFRLLAQRTVDALLLPHVIQFNVMNQESSKNMKKREKILVVPEQEEEEEQQQQQHE